MQTRMLWHMVEGLLDADARSSTARANNNFGYSLAHKVWDVVVAASWYTRCKVVELGTRGVRCGRCCCCSLVHGVCKVVFSGNLARLGMSANFPVGVSVARNPRRRAMTNVIP
eukprot:scaffold204828_cov21-Tisochrysis_lutea.AAC.2